MSDDPKTDFYLANRVLIEEWAALRAPAAAALESALFSGAHRFDPESGLPAPEFNERGNKEIGLFFAPKEGALPAPRVVLWWQTGDLFRGTSGWPLLLFVLNPEWKSLRDSLRSTLTGRMDALGMPGRGKASDWWMWHGRLTPPAEPVEIEAYADYCLERLRIAFDELRETVIAAVEVHGHNDEAEPDSLA